MSDTIEYVVGKACVGGWVGGLDVQACRCL